MASACRQKRGDLGTSRSAGSKVRLHQPGDWVEGGMTACGTKRTCQPRRSASALRTKRTSASDSKRLECDGKPHGTSAHAVRSLSEVGFVPGVCHEKLVGLLCDGAFDPCDGRDRCARRCENFKGQAAVSSDKAPGRHNLERSHEASTDPHLNCKNWRSDAVTLSASRFSNTRTGGFNG